MSKGQPAATLSSNRRLIVILVFLCLFLDNFSLYMLAPILDDVVTKLGVAKERGALLYCIKPLVSLPCSLLAGKLVAKLGSLRTCGIGIVCYFICCWQHAYATSIYAWAGARVTQAIGSALTVGAGMLLIRQCTDEHNRGRYMGLAFTGNGLGVFAGPLFGGLYYVRLGQSHVYGALSAVALLQGLVCLLAAARKGPRNGSPVSTRASPEIKPVTDVHDDMVGYPREGDAIGSSLSVHSPPPPPPSPLATCRLVLAQPRMLCILLAATSACSVLGLVEPCLPALIKESLGFTDEQLALFWASGAAVYPVMVLFGGWLSDRIPRHRLLQAGLIGFACCLPLWVVLRQRVATVWLYLALLFGLDALVDSPVQPLIASVVESLGLDAGGSIGFTLGDVGQNFGYLIGPLLSIEIEKRAHKPLYPLLIMSGWFATVLVVVTVVFKSKTRSCRGEEERV